MQQGLRQHMGLGKRSRHSVIATAWLCFLIAATPCLTAWATACCPSTPQVTGDSEPHSHGAQGHHGDTAHTVHDMALGERNQEPGDAQLAHDCGASAGSCCDEALPTLEERSPKPLPTAGDAGLSASLEVPPRIGTQTPGHRKQATGPPERLRLHPRPHLEHCSFLI